MATTYESLDVQVTDSATSTQTGGYNIPDGKRVTGVAVATLSGTPNTGTTVSVTTAAGVGIPKQPYQLLLTSTSVPLNERYTAVDLVKAQGKINIAVTPNGAQAGTTIITFVFRLESI